MSLAAGVTMMGRKQAEALMESTCVITRSAGETVDHSTGATVPATTTTIYTGKCRLRMPDNRSNDVTAAAQMIAVQSPVLSLPVVGSEEVRTNDVAVVSSPLDAATVTVRITGLDVQTHATARRFPVEVSS